MKDNFFLNEKGRVLSILFISFFFFSLMIVSAAIDTQRVDDTFQLNEIINYAKPCFNNGTYCSSSAVCNYTVFDTETKAVIYNNSQATNAVAYHNLSMVFTQIGIYQIDMVCHDGDLKGAETFYAQITGSGDNDNIWIYILILVFSLGAIIYGISIQDATITILGGLGSTFLAFYTLNFGIAGFKDTVYTDAFGIILLGLSFYVLIKSTHELITA